MGFLNFQITTVDFVDLDNSRKFLIGECQFCHLCTVAVCNIEMRISLKNIT